MASFEEEDDESGGPDRLTGLPDRDYLERRLREEVHRAIRYEQAFTLVMMRVDDFESVLDAFGRKGGNQVLLKLAYVLKQAIRESDVLVRHGDDGFSVILVQAGRDQAAAWVERARAAFSAALEGHPRFSGCRLAAGLCACPRDALTAVMVLEQAETAMYGNHGMPAPAADPGPGKGG